MIIGVAFENKSYTVNLNEPIDISLPLQDGVNNPNCYWADPVKFEIIRSGSFVGSVNEGGSVNYQKLSITPHGNGTHSECYGHISADGATINNCLNQFHFYAELITVSPELNSGGDFVITRKILSDKIKSNATQALVIRTIPNEESKKIKQYTSTNPPYIESEAIDYIVSLGLEHLLIDLPSVDKEVDEGKLLSHKAFWKFPGAIRRNCTITELTFVDDLISDGLYLLNLQITSLEMDASPSKPVLYKLEEVL